MEIHFDLYIPFHIQKEVTADVVPQETATEHFRVTILYTYHSPVAFIESVAASGAYRPSTAVWIVREYLEREINRAELPVVFESLGPSPFHAEFYLEQVSGPPGFQARSPFEVEHVRTRGYADITFKYSSEVFTEPDDALGALYYEVGDELGLFYDFNLADMAAYRSWQVLQESVLELTEPTTRPRLPARARAAWKQGRQIHLLHSSLVRFEATHLLERHRFEHHLRSTYATDEPTYLRPFLEAEASDRPLFPTQQIGQLIGFLEERRSKAVELLIVLIAALVGGAAGSLVTLMAQH